MYHKWQSYDVWFLRYGVWQTEFFVILDHFLPFYPPKNPKNQNFEKMKQPPGDIIILHMCTINDNHMMYGSRDMERDRQNHLSFWTIVYCITSRKIKFWKTEKMPGDIIILHKCTKITITCYTVPEIWHLTDVSVIFHFGLLFALLPP